MNVPAIVRLLAVAMILGLLCPRPGTGEEPDSFAGLAVRQLSIHEGLSQNTVTALLQDRRGFIWLGTREGLNRYDGNKCQVFRPEPGNPKSLAGSQVNTLLEDSRGALWVGTKGGGLNRFDHRTETFTCHLPEPEDFQSGGNAVTALAEDETGRLWVGTTGGGLFCFDSGTGLFSRPAIGALTDVEVLCLLAGSDGSVWVGTLETGLWRIGPDGRTSRNYRNRPGEPASIDDGRINTLVETHDGTVWVGTGLEGIHGIDPRTGFVSRTALWDVQDSITNAAQITSLAVAPDGALWIGSNSHFLARLAGDELTWYVPSRMAEGKSTTGNRSLLFDRAGTLWIGTNGYGADVITPKAQNFETVGVLAREKLPCTSVRAIHTATDGTVWVGGYGGLARLDPARGGTPETVTGDGPARLRDQHGTWVNGNVMVVYDHPEDPSGALWVGSEGDGLYRFDRRNNRFRHMPLAASPDTVGLVGARVYSMLFLPPETLLVGTELGLNSFNVRDSSWHYFDARKPVNLGLASGQVNALHLDRRGMIWIGTSLGGISVYDPGTRSFTPYTADPRQSDSLSCNSVFHFHEDGYGVLWVATGAGFDRFDGDSGTFTAYHTVDGLPGETVYGILPDDRGCLWLSTNNGLSCFDPREETFLNFSAEDGLQADEFNGGARHRAPDGTLYFGGIEGLTRFDPDKLVHNRYVPPVVITGLSINNRPVPVGEPFDGRAILEAAVSETREVILSHRDAVISFEFAALNYIHPAENRYAIMMEGFEKDWAHIGSRRFASYTNLSPGRYTFRVKAANDDGVWNDEGTALAIIVLPPFWGTWWFRLLAFLVFAGAILGSVQLRMRLLKRQKDTLERTVSQRTEDLRRSESRIVAVMESLPFDLFVLDAEGRYLLQNASCRRHWGELAGRSGEGGDPIGVPGEIDAAARQRALSGETIEQTVVRTMGGGERHIHQIMAPIMHRGKSIGALGVLMDVSERVNAEERRRQLEVRVQEAQRLESLALLAGGVAHDFNNLLTAILGSTELARLSLDDHEAVGTSLREIEQAAGQAADLCRQMLAYSGRGQFLVGPADLDQVVRGMEDLLRSLSPVKSPLELRLDGNLPAVEADVSQLQQVVLNLVTNAAEASGERSGPIVLSTSVERCSQERLDGFLLGEELPAGRYVCLQVSDHGCGMDRQTRDHVFEPFFSTKFVGRGLGLAAVLGIVRGHGGAIRLESAPGRGSVFTVLLPTADGYHVERAVGRKKTEAEPWQGNGTILLAEDEPQVLKIGEAMLRRLGFEVLTSANGREAVDLYRTHGDEIAAVVLDLTMPTMGGERALKKILDLDPGARVILASGYSEVELAGQYAEAGLAGFLQKPYTLATLRKVLRRVLDASGSPVSRDRAPSD